MRSPNFQRARFLIPAVLLSVLSHFNMLAQTGRRAGKVTDIVVKPLEFTSQQSADSFGMFNSYNSPGGQTGKFKSK